MEKVTSWFRNLDNNKLFHYIFLSLLFCYWLFHNIPYAHEWDQVSLFKHIYYPSAHLLFGRVGYTWIYGGIWHFSNIFVKVPLEQFQLVVMYFNMGFAILFLDVVFKLLKYFQFNNYVSYLSLFILGLNTIFITTITGVGGDIIPLYLIFLALYLWLKGKNIYASIAFGYAVFTREQSIFFILSFMILEFMKYRPEVLRYQLKKILLLISFTLFFLALGPVYGYMIEGQPFLDDFIIQFNSQVAEGYSSFYKKFSLLLGHLSFGLNQWKYFLIFGLGIFLYKKKVNPNQMTFLIALFIPLIPMAYFITLAGFYYDPRYFIVLFLLLSILVAMSLHSLFSLCNRSYSKLVYTGMIFTIVCVNIMSTNKAFSLEREKTFEIYRHAKKLVALHKGKPLYLPGEIRQFVKVLFYDQSKMKGKYIAKRASNFKKEDLAMAMLKTLNSGNKIYISKKYQDSLDLDNIRWAVDHISKKFNDDNFKKDILYLN